MLRTKQRDIIEARLDDAGARVAAKGLLQALDLDASAVHMSLGSTATVGRGCATGCLYGALVFGLPVVIGTIATAIQVLGGYEGYAGVLFIALLATAVVATGAVFSLRALRSAEVTIGSDGLWIRRAPWRKRFVPYRELRLAFQRGDEAVIETESDRLAIHCQDGGATNQLVRRIDEAHTQWLEAARAIDLAELDRGDREPALWRDQLLALFEHAKSYRARALQRDDLWQVLEDPKASPERRVGAALALSRRAKTGERRRVRIAAASCALRPLRIAIEEAAEGEIEAQALEEAMKAHRSKTR
ncbi:MAG: hypothetical protein JRI68_25035 [Deltaproteobacteria bacterium]|nr:hypothetical protein [Deltaproteobacteria bacterium]